MSAGTIPSSDVRAAYPLSPVIPVHDPSPVLPGKTPPLTGAEPPLFNANDPSRVPVNTSSDMHTASATEVLRNAMAALQLPVDSLSTALLAFCRFFSLAPQQMLLGNLRKEILGSGKYSVPETLERGQKDAGVQAKALASLAVFDKGIMVSPKAFNRYALLFEVPDPLVEPVGTDPREGHTMSDNGNSSSGDSPEREDPPAPDELRTIAEQETSKDTLLDLLNKLPGNNDQRWVVYSFKTKVNGIEVAVICRLLKGGASPFGTQEKAVIDITAPKRHYRCFLNSDTVDGSLCADIRLYPGLPDRELTLMAKRLNHFLDTAAGLSGAFRGFKGGFKGTFNKVRLCNGDDSPSWVEDLLGVWPSVDEKV